MRKITQLLGEAYGRAASVANVVSGFARTGIWPVDPNVFEDSDFAPSTLESYSSASAPGTANSATESQAATSSKPGQETNGPKPKSTTYYRRVNEISPLPKSTGIRTRKATAMTVLTNTPHKVQQEYKSSCKAKKRKLSFPESITQRKPSWFCKLKIGRNARYDPMHGVPRVGPIRLCKSGTKDEEVPS
jgi:hypothetical protein